MTGAHPSPTRVPKELDDPPFMIALALTVIGVMLASAICSGTEAALFSVTTVRARQAAEENHRGSKALLTVREDMKRPIATIVILNNIANIVGSIMVGSIAAEVLGSQWLGAFSAGLTFLIIVFSEIIPKTMGERHALRVSLLAAGPLLALTQVMRPLNWLIERITAPFTKGGRDLVTNEGEIRLLAEMGGNAGVIEEDEAQMIKQVFKLNDTTATDVMTPRIAMTYLKGHLTLAEARDDIIASQHSRIVVVGETRDEVIGVALKIEILTAMVEGAYETPVSRYSQPARFVNEDAKADNLLDFFQRTRQHLAVVVDGYGGVSGIVTLEDVLEVLTGEIMDETDRAEDMQQVARDGPGHLPDEATEERT